MQSLIRGVGGWWQAAACSRHPLPRDLMKGDQINFTQNFPPNILFCTSLETENICFFYTKVAHCFQMSQTPSSKKTFLLPTLLCTRTMNEGAVSQCVCPAPYHARCPDKILPWCCGCFVTPQIKTDETLWMRLLTVAVVVQGTERQGRVTPPVRILMLLEKCGE